MQAYFERFTVKMTKAQARDCSHQGDCYQDCKDTAQQLGLKINPEDLRAELRDYGAWSEEELSNHNENLIRIVWIAAGDILEELK